MSSQSTGETACKHCGQPLPADRLGEICHACLMQEGLQSWQDEGPDTELPTDIDSADNSKVFTRSDPLEGTTLGPGGRYKILQVIGGGGFGTVYMAEQSDPVRRRVAVKVLKAGMDTRQVVARFEAERQALAMMDHPNIAKVLDGGETEQGRPFFVMELVRGTPITHYCDREQLAPKARLRLFTQVCRAVQHAHQKGIIHRDLKPSNILVTAPDGAEPVPKVIDFGVAKALESNLTDKTLFTRFEQMIGTPAYMSPEQAGTEGGIDVDTRADIYALGVLLYELLTGTTPFEANTLQRAAFEEVRRILREEDAPRPSTRLSSLESARRTTIAKERGTEAGGLNKLLRGDLDWIVMKAIEKDRRRRYETANALAADVERHLADEPVNAGPPTAAYRTGKFLRRHKAPLGIAATVAILLVAGIAASSWQAIRATKERDRALNAETMAEERQKEAEAISEFITGIFEAAKPGAEDGGRSITVEESLKGAVKQLEENQGMPAERRGELLSMIADVYSSLGKHPEAVAVREKVVEMHEAAEDPDNLLSAEAMLWLAVEYRHTNKRAEAPRLAEAAVDTMTRVLGAEHVKTLNAKQGLALCYMANQRIDEGVSLGSEVLDARRRILGQESRKTLESMQNLAVALGAAGRHQEAVDLNRQLLDTAIKTRGPEDPATLNAMGNLADSLFALGREEEAVEVRREVHEMASRSVGETHPLIVRNLTNLANFLKQPEQAQEAYEMREKALQLSQEVMGEDHPHTIMAMINLSSSVLDLGREQESIELLERALEMGRKGQGETSSNALLAMQNLAATHRMSGRLEEALKIDREFLELSKNTLGPEHPSTLRAMHGLAISIYNSGRPEEAMKIQEEVLALRRKILGEQHSETRAAMNNLTLTLGRLASSLYSEGRKEEALALREKRFELHQSVDGMDHPDTLDAMFNLSWLYIATGQPAEAIELLKREVELRRKSMGLEHADTLRAMGQLAFAYGDADLLEDAIATVEEQLPLCEDALGPSHPHTMIARGNLAYWYAEVGREAEALVVLRHGSTAVNEDSPKVVDRVVGPHSEWRWLHSSDGVDPMSSDPDFHRTFFRADFDDSSWQQGTDSDGPHGGFGYGDEGFTGVDLGAPAVKGLSKAAYFRCRFTTGKEHANLELRCQRDDGIIVYLDGREVLRDNVKDGEESYALPAQFAVSGEAETTLYRFPLTDLVLPPGDHVLAISLHNTENPSSDLRIGEISLVEVEDVDPITQSSEMVTPISEDP